MTSLASLLNHSDSDESVNLFSTGLASGSTSSGSESKLSLQNPSDSSTAASSTPGSAADITPPGEKDGELSGKKLPKSKVDKRFFPLSKMVKIALRKKNTKKSASAAIGSKLHLKSLEAALRVKLTVVPSLASLYCSLTPNTNRKPIRQVDELAAERTNAPVFDYVLHNDFACVSKLVQLIDSDLVNLSGVSNKILLAFGAHQAKVANGAVPTFNSLDTAISTLFGTPQYTLVRVTRSATDEADGSLVLKLETAKPGDLLLIDDKDFVEDMLHSISKEGRRPNNLFIKKIVARPRYKSGMKIYFIPYACSASLYVDSRMLERDLFEGVLDSDMPQQKLVAAAFDYHLCVNEYKNAVEKSRNSGVPVSMLAPGPNGSTDSIPDVALKLNHDSRG